MSIKRIVLIALLSAVLFVQETILSFLPNIQLTFLLLIIYTKTVGFKNTIVIIFIHSFLDNLINGSFIPQIIIPMLLGYLIIPITLGIYFKNVKKPLILALFSVLFSIWYSFMFVLVNVLFLEVKISAYIIGDLPFTLILICCNFLVVLWLYSPLIKPFKILINKYY